LDIYGSDLDPTTLPRLRTFVEDHGLHDHVCCHGPYKHADVSKILAGADLVVLPSEWEGLPLVLVEAMQYGVPIVATNVGGNSELGEANADAIITKPAWGPFVDGLLQMAMKLRSGDIDAVRLHRWAEQRYGHDIVAAHWRRALLDSPSYFSQQP
jgi:glycosyltransferase involved in cell wall biosynthesis